MSRSSELFVRYLRQRQELGETDLILGPTVAGALRSVDDQPVAGDRSHAAGSVAAAGGAAPVPTRTRGDSSPLVSIGSLDELQGVANGCFACGLADTRTTVVFADGNPAAEVVVVGEAPGADEDRVGRPFVGRAGKLLDQLLVSVGFSRDRVYICNVLKCRPPGNRNPQPDEVQACSPFLRGQLEFVAPKVILACGAFAAQTLLTTGEPIGRLRKKVHTCEGVPLVATYHPAALLRNPSWIRPVWEDLQRLRSVLEA